MARNYTPPSDEFAKLLDGVVEEHRHDLSDATFDVTQADKLGSGSPVVCKRANASERRRGADLCMVYSAEVFDNVTTGQAKALIDNALADWAGVPKKGAKGQPATTVYKPRRALALHPEVVKRHGLVLKEWNVAVEALGQLDLFDAPLVAVS